MSARAIAGHVVLAFALAGAVWAYVAGLEAVAVVMLGER